MMKRRITSLLLVIILLLAIPAQALDLSATGACSMDFASEEVLYAKNIDTQMVPASLTKIMTLYIVFEKLADGTLTKSTPIPISKNAATFSRSSEASNIPLTSGSTVPLETIINAITIVSACACCTAVAEYISGSEAEFVKLMNQKAASLGIEAKFIDCHGLSNYNRISPRGMAKLTSALISSYPDVLNYTKKPYSWILGKKYTSTNALLRSGGSYYYAGADGFKTGTTSRAGNCLVSTAYKNGTRVISVVMNAKTASARYTDSIKLLNYGFSQLDYINTYLYTTDIKAYIDDFEIPCCYYLGKDGSLCVIAENLNSFGFDTEYDSKTSTVYIYENDAKEIYTMVPGDDAPMTPLYKIQDKTSKKAVLVTSDGRKIQLNTVYTLNSQTAISIDELAKYFDSSWNSETRKLQIITN